MIMEYRLKCIFRLSAWTLCCVISVASQCSDNSRFAYKIEAYKDRHYRDIGCALYRTSEQGEVKCTVMCNSHRSTCYFFLLHGHGADCIICDSNGGSLAASNYSLTEDTIIYEKQDNEDGCSPNPCADDAPCVDDIFGYKCLTCESGICVQDTSCIVSYGPYGGTGGSHMDDAAMKDNGFVTAIHITINVGGDTDCIGLTYGNTEGTCHGNPTAVQTTYTLAEGEYITAVSGGPSNGIIAKLEFTTNTMRTIGPFGAYTGDSPFSFDSGGRALAYISGRTGNRMDNIAFHFYC